MELSFYFFNVCCSHFILKLYIDPISFFLIQLAKDLLNRFFKLPALRFCEMSLYFFFLLKIVFIWESVRERDRERKHEPGEGPRSRLPAEQRPPPNVGLNPSTSGSRPEAKVYFTDFCISFCSSLHTLYILIFL